MTLTLDQLRDILAEEQDTPALCKVSHDITDKYKEARQELKQSLTTAIGDAVDVILAREESMRYTWEDLMKIRLGKIVKCAMQEAETGSRPDLTGILPWELQVYGALVDDMNTYNHIAGVTRE
jgi:hypothetical protein